MNRKIRVAINGFGRIGRVFTRRVYRDYRDKIDIVAINDPGSTDALAHLLEFDSVQGRWDANISGEEGCLIVDGDRIPHTSVMDPSELDWRSAKPDLVLEATGKFKRKDKAMAHIAAGAPRCIITAVADGEDVKTVVLGANEDILDGEEQIISNASCTTNCAAPLVDVIDREFGIESGFITTVHSYTGDQSLHDRAHVDLRRARAAALSIIPTSTGAAKAITRVFPHLDGQLGGAGIRVPVPNGSLTDITYIVKEKTDIDTINKAFRRAAEEGSWKGYLQFTDKPLVSSDIIGNPYSCVYDSELTAVLGNMVKIVGWYDNETGYASRLCDLTLYWSELWDGFRNP